MIPLSREGLDPVATVCRIVGIGRAGIGAAGGERVVAEIGGGRGARPEVFRVGEGLADQAGADLLAAAVGDEAPLGLFREDGLGDAGDDGRVDAAADDGEGDERAGWRVLVLS